MAILLYEEIGSPLAGELSSVSETEGVIMWMLTADPLRHACGVPPPPQGGRLYFENSNILSLTVVLGL